MQIQINFSCLQCQLWLRTAQCCSTSTRWSWPQAQGREARRARLPWPCSWQTRQLPRGRKTCLNLSKTRTWQEIFLARYYQIKKLTQHIVIKKTFLGETVCSPSAEGEVPKVNERLWYGAVFNILLQIQQRHLTKLFNLCLVTFDMKSQNKWWRYYTSYLDVFSRG